jgi:hypothetical protein
MRMDQEAQLNAPDPRDSRPPCYEDALLMPRLDGSFASLDELGIGPARAKRNRRKKDNDTENEDDVEIRRNRSRSEEVISMRETVRNTLRPQPRVHIISTMNRDSLPLPPPPPPEASPPSISTRSAPPDEIHYHSTDIMGLNHNTPAASTSNGPLQTVDAIQNFHSNESSPYAKRKTNMSTFRSPSARSNQSSNTSSTPIVVVNRQRDRNETTTSIHSGISQLSDDSARSSYSSPIEAAKNLRNRNQCSPNVSLREGSTSVAQIHHRSQPDESNF